jgi:hypothetical protein
VFFTGMKNIPDHSMVNGWREVWFQGIVKAVSVTEARNDGLLVRVTIRNLESCTDTVW